MDVALKRTVLLITDSLNPGGAERQMLLLAENLPCQWKPEVIAISPGPLSEKYKDAGIRIHIVERKVRFDALVPILKIMKLVRQLKPSIVHSWGWMSSITGALASIGVGIPHIAGGIRLGGLPRRRKLLLKYSARLGDIAIANSEAGLRAWGIPESKGKVIYNGFDWNRLGNGEPKSAQTNTFNVTMIAAMADRKDWDQFINTARLFTHIHKETNIIFNGYGDGPQRRQFISQSKDLIELGLLRLPGYAANPITECYKSDIGILLSTYGEGISNSIMEFMACGKPVICSNSGGNPELVIDNTTGFLVEYNNPPEQITEKIKWLLDNPEKAREMGEAGRHRLKKLFSIERMVESYVDIYN